MAKNNSTTTSQTRETTATAQFQGKNNGNYAQSQNTETQPTNWKSTVTQNEFEHPIPQNVGEINSNPIRGLKPQPAKRGETTAPNKIVSTALTWIEHSNQSVRECNLALNSKNTRKTYPTSACNYQPAREGKMASSMHANPQAIGRMNRPSTSA